MHHPHIFLEINIGEWLNFIIGILSARPFWIFIITIIFKNEISYILKNLKNIKGFGLEGEVKEEISETLEGVESIKKNIDNNNLIKENGKEIIENIIKNEEDEKFQIIKIRLTIEDKIKEATLSMGYLSKHKNYNLDKGIEFISKYVDNIEFGEMINSFKKYRNILIHEYEYNPSKNDIKKILDIGYTILDILSTINYSIYTVKDVVDTYSDKEGQKKNSYYAVILENNKNTGQYGVYCTTNKLYYKGIIGESVSWDWSFEHQFGESYYKDPKTNQIKMGRSSSAEFIGKNIKDL